MKYVLVNCNLFDGNKDSEVVKTKRENVFTLNPSYHFAFLLLHLAKHMASSGAGVRMYLDLAIMLKNEPNIDFDKVIDYSNTLLDLNVSLSDGKTISIIEGYGIIKAKIYW